MAFNLQDEINEVTSTSTNNTETKPITINLNGKAVTFSTVDELNTDLSSAITALSQEYQQMAQKVKEYEAGIHKPTHQNDDGTSISNNQNDSGFSQERYIALLRENAIDAQEYLDSFRFGTEKPTEFIKTSLKSAQEVKEEQEAARWISRHPEFPGGAAAQTLDKIRVSLNLPMTAQNLEVAYQHGIQSGVIPDYKTMAVMNQFKNALLADIQQKGGQLPEDYMAQVQQPNNVVAMPSRVNAPPVAPRTSFNSGGIASEEQLDKLSFDQVEAILKKHNQI